MISGFYLFYSMVCKEREREAPWFAESLISFIAEARRGERSAEGREGLSFAKSPILDSLLRHKQRIRMRGFTIFKAVIRAS